MQTKDITVLTYLNHRTVENYRTKIRQILGLKPKDNLITFLDEL
jgi:hypothetical protein